MSAPRPLPIDAHLGEALSLLEKHPSLVVEAPPGTGKTTRLPAALLKASWRAPQQKILVLEPRRLAARFAAQFVAQERGVTVGQEVGYQFRFESVHGPTTQLLYLTEGTFVRWISGNPRLEGVAAVVLDEFHERHLQTDIALAYTRWLQGNGRPDLRLVVMSATLDSTALVPHLGGCPVLKVETPLFPVEIRHRPGPLARPLDREVAAAVEEAVDAAPEGDLLVFLPGMGEIRRAEAALAPLARARSLDVLPLHGELDPREQERALRPGPRRRVILSTNVAESSLTLDGVSIVIDSGLHRRASHSWWSGLPALHTRPICRASAVQRTGRAGRQRPGLCLRLYTAHDFQHRPPQEVPELQRSDLAQAVLDLKASGIPQVEQLQWLEPPNPDALTAALQLLYRLGAVERPQGGSPLTPLGRRLAQFPTGPRLARVLVEAERQGVVEEALRVVALLSGTEDTPLDPCDHPPPPRGFVAERLQRQLRGLLKGTRGTPTVGDDPRDRLAFSLLTGFPDRVARKRPQPPGRHSAAQPTAEIVFCGGGTALVSDVGNVSHHDTFVVLEAQQRSHGPQGRTTTRATCLTPIEDEWLFALEPTVLEDKRELAWDAQRQRVVERKSLSYEQLVLESSEGPPEDSPAVAAVLLRELLGVSDAAALKPLDWVKAFERVGAGEWAEGLFARAQILHRAMPDKVADPESSSLTEALAQALVGVKSKREWDSLDWTTVLTGALLGSEGHRLESWLPSQITLAGGRRTKVNYRWGQAPFVASRMQDFFGMSDGPTLLQGRIPLALHLLAPNQRAVQITSDLKGFWARHYPELRKSLKIRYPRHPWPENPLAPLPPTKR